MELQQQDVEDRFVDAMPHAERADEHILYQDSIDGKAWVSDSKTLLLTPEVTQYDNIDFDSYTDSEYVGTEYFENNTGYGFTADDHTHWVNVNILRQLANDVLDVSYDEIRSWAKTSVEAEVSNRAGDNAPVLFDVPDSEYRVVISPIIP